LADDIDADKVAMPQQHQRFTSDGLLDARRRAATRA
jgi:hypothetical protein